MSGLPFRHLKSSTDQGVLVLTITEARLDGYALPDELRHEGPELGGGHGRRLGGLRLVAERNVRGIQSFLCLGGACLFVESILGLAVDLHEWLSLPR